MATSLYLSIHQSYAPGTEESARSLAESVARALAANRMAPLHDPDDPPSLVEESRLAKDHHTAEWLGELGDLAGEGRPHAYLLKQYPYRLIYVPREMRRPIALDHGERWGKKEISVALGSSSALLRELSAIAPELGIPLNRDGKIDDDVAAKMARAQPLEPGEEGDIVDHWRTVWLLVYEAARVSSERNLPLVLAG